MMRTALFVLCSVIFLALFAAAVSDLKPVQGPQIGHPERGMALFRSGTASSPACATCHASLPNQRRASYHGGPSLAGIGQRAAERVPGMSASAYLVESILHPRRYLVSGYSNMMFARYTDHLTTRDIADIVAYMLTL
jgi:mono/diheme cytochrome c family protein